MKNLKQYLPLAAIAAGVFALRKSKSVSGVGSASDSATGRIIKLYGKKHSLYGNPSYAVLFQTSDGRVLDGRTASNGSVGYKLGSYWEGRPAVIYYHRTPSGKIVFTDIKDMR